MGKPAVLLGDKILGSCPIHKVNGPNGSAVPVPALPFAAPITESCSTKVLIAGKPVALEGSGGVNSTPHPNLHPSDTYFSPPSQRGKVDRGSPSVKIQGRGVAYTGCPVSQCGGQRAEIAGSGSTVLIGS